MIQLRIGIIIFFYLFSAATFAQTNAIKGTAFYYGYPFVPDIILSDFSLGYEKKITDKNAIVINVFAVAHGYAGESNVRFKGFATSFKHNFRNSENRLSPWLSPYFLYYYRNSYGAGYSDHGYFLGAGVSAGVRYFFSEKKKWFLDGGMGLAYGEFKYMYYMREIPIEGDDGAYPVDYAIPNPEYSWIPRPILQVGFTF